MEATIEKTATAEYGTPFTSDREHEDSSEQDFDSDDYPVREPRDSFECSSTGHGEIAEIMVLNRALRMMQFAGAAKLRVTYR